VDDYVPAPDRRQLRASDADRDKVAEVLREALAEGRLTPEEHSDRIDRVYHARTLGELEPITADLPAVRDRALPIAPGPGAAQSSPPAVAVFSEVKRRGRWIVGPETTAVAVFGAVKLDLTEAVLPREVTIRAFSVFGSVKVDVPEDAEVHGGGFAVFGARDMPDEVSAARGGPVVQVTGLTLFGDCVVRRRRPRRGPSSRLG